MNKKHRFQMTASSKSVANGAVYDIGLSCGADDQHSSVWDKLYETVRRATNDGRG